MTSNPLAPAPAPAAPQGNYSAIAYLQARGTSLGMQERGAVMVIAAWNMRDMVAKMQQEGAATHVITAWGQRVHPMIVAIEDAEIAAWSDPDPLADAAPPPPPGLATNADEWGRAWLIAGKMRTTIGAMVAYAVSNVYGATVAADGRLLDAAGLFLGLIGDVTMSLLYAGKATGEAVAAATKKYQELAKKNPVTTATIVVVLAASIGVAWWMWRKR